METLPEVKMLNVAKELKGMEVLAPVTGEKLGEAMDALIHPTEGRLIGIMLSAPDGEVRTLGATDLEIRDGTIAAAEGALLHRSMSGVTTEDVYASADVLGALVITDRGWLLGRVSEIYISVATQRAYYHVVKSEWQRIMGGGFFMAGDVPRSYFHRNSRLIVPADTQDRCATKSLAETA
jgi:sporulation protein YlmC with PRC-barrel domain